MSIARLVILSCCWIGMLTTVQAEELRDKALAWIEAESAESGPGIDVDRSKGRAASEGAVLGVHSDQTPALACRWKIAVAKDAGSADLLIRFAGMKEGRYVLALDGLRLGAVEYTHDAREAIERAEGDTAVFLISPVGIDSVMSLADQGERMPQKSTFFHPKLGTGIVFHPLYE